MVSDVYSQEFVMYNDTGNDISLRVAYRSSSVAEWLARWTRAQKGLGSNRNRDAVG